VRLNDLFDTERGPKTLLTLALYPLVFLVVWQGVAALLGQLSAISTLIILLCIVLTSPIAYLLRKARGRGAERGWAEGASRRNRVGRARRRSSF